MVNRRSLLGVALVAVAASPARAVSGVEFLYNDGCGCCHKWAVMMAEAGMPVSFKGSPDLLADHERLGIPARIAGCHVGLIDGYAVSGHVPPADVLRLLAQRPEAVGITVPGMPVGSPGMEYDDRIEPYDVLLVKADGSTAVFARHGA